MPDRLTSEKIRELYDLYRKQKTFQNWHNSYVEEVKYFQEIKGADLRTPQNQERLWKANRNFRDAP
jgi:hypothetical protein